MKQKGFSLIELLIYIALSMVVMTAVFQMFDSNRRVYTSGGQKMEAQQNARIGIDEITKQLRMAGYYPENFDADAANDLASTNAIHIATNTSLAVYGDLDGSGSSNVFIYCLDGSVVRRGKATIALSTYTCSAGETLAENVTSLRFAYYDSTGANIPANGTAPYQLDSQNIGTAPTFTDVTQRGAIRRVVVTLTARQTSTSQSAQIYTLTSDVKLRNIS